MPQGNLQLMKELIVGLRCANTRELAASQLVRGIYSKNNLTLHWEAHMLLQHTHSIFMFSRAEVAMQAKCCGGKNVITTQHIVVQLVHNHPCNE